MGATPAPGRLSEPPPELAARRYAQRLLDDLGAQVRAPLALPDEHPALTWRDSGLAALTGRADGPPTMCPLPIAACADGVLAALDALDGRGVFAGERGAARLAERAPLAGFRRQGRISPGGACRLLDAADGRIALSIARADDWELLPAWLEADVAPGWDAVAAAVSERSAATLVERGALLGLALALDAPPVAGTPWFRVAARGPASANPRPRVVDLSSLWAGPLCGALLQALGAEVIKVESAARPDGARNGAAAFFERLNAGKACRRIDFGSSEGRAQLAELIDGADIVIEASRPRALRQLGIDAEKQVAARAGVTWVSITGHGRDAATAQRIAFGDDAGVAAGLSWVLAQAAGEPLFCGDAIADPLTGLHAALAAWSSHLAGGGCLLDLSLQGVAAHAAALDRPADLPARQREWSRRAGLPTSA